MGLGFGFQASSCRFPGLELKLSQLQAYVELVLD